MVFLQRRIVFGSVFLIPENNVEDWLLTYPIGLITLLSYVTASGFVAAVLLPVVKNIFHNVVTCHLDNGFYTKCFHKTLMKSFLAPHRTVGCTQKCGFTPHSVNEKREILSHQNPLDTLFCTLSSLYYTNHSGYQYYNMELDIIYIQCLI